ncbi:AfsR/SARP family transcriptional regulator [Nonomuraea typhae]|uniref:AfsR/SARP family transcriptional regulator n=1 Tax=Nonomuraea typhae TaxID=2603600 RepID=UPI0015E243DD|nr:AfsR/SARP family transcriptional regulator [Nonomuraea typhae]
MLDFKLLGPISVRHEYAGILALRGAKVRQAISLLAANAGRIVTTAQFIDELWPARTPKDALKTLQTHIYYLRRMLGPAGPLVATDAAGYVLHADPARVDALVFPRLVEQATRHARADRVERAEQLLERALGLWTGPSALAGAPLGMVLAPLAGALGEQRMRALETSVALRIRLGRHGEVIEELRLLVAAHPLNETFHSQLITALTRAGRRTDARRAYEGLRILLDAELGVPPTFDLPALH